MDSEKVIKGLEELCKKSNCPFVCFDALELLKAQRETIDELISADKALKLLKEQEMRECCLCKHYDSVYKHCNYHDHDVEESEYCSRWVKYDV